METDTPTIDTAAPTDHKRRKGDFTPLYLLIPIALKARLKASAAAHNRRVAHEVISALESWTREGQDTNGQ